MGSCQGPIGGIWDQATVPWEPHFGTWDCDLVPWTSHGKVYVSLLRPLSPLEDLLLEMDSDLSEASFRPTDVSNNSKLEKDANLINLTLLELPHLPLSHLCSEYYSGPWSLVVYSNNPDDNTDKDI
jgi:hypothetical protein